ncbi:HofP DNA utilization family protein [Enterobacter chuandaensis]|uniref:HofP DNA utilization family protein n=1 Tax=Enterobacter chuandaensis TaxID=2497875 RepID=UPI001C2DFEE5|nr:HofP DNA utilization family protein [Enterobacter chuandaensis]
MRNSAKYLLVCSALLLTGMRDPFRPPDDPCATGELARWHYRGMVEGQQAIAILQDGQQRWYRLKAQERFPAGWQITDINETELTIAVGETCEPEQWTWQREGKDKNESKDSAVAAGVQPPAVGRRAKAGHAGGG